MSARTWSTPVIWMLTGGMLAFAGYALRRHQGADAVRPASPPAYSAPEQQTVEEAWENKILPIRWTIRNTGGSDLIIDNIRLACACSGLFRTAAPGGLEPLSTLKLAPGSSEELHWPLVVRAPIESAVTFRVDFRTNDPQRREATFTVVVKRVRGDLRLKPGAVSFGPVTVGQVAEAQVELVADPPYTDRVLKLSASQEWCGVERLPAENEVINGERLLARARVWVKPESAGTHQVELIVLTTAGLERRFPMVVQASDHIECWPKTIFLPRRVYGERVWTQEVWLQARAGGPVEVGDVQAPEGVRVEILQKQGRTLLRLTVEEAARNRGPLDVTGRATAGDKSSRFTLRILTGGSP